jgi:predicted dehydrogenase
VKFNIGVLGATGFIGTPYRKEIRESPDDATIIAVHGRRKDLLEAAGQEDQAQLATDDWRQVVEHPDVNLVLVCTPDALHREAVLRAAQLGKHVICEKPIGMNVREAGEMWRAIEAAGVGHFVPFWTRYVPVFRRVKDLLQQGLIGELRAVIYRWHNPRPANTPFTWRDNADLSSAGSVADVGSHAYDALRWMLGLEATRVLAHADVITPVKPDLGEVNLAEAIAWGQQHALDQAAWRRKGTASDYASIAFELENGAVGTLILSHATFIRKGLAPEIELHGVNASLAIDRIKGTITLTLPGEEPQIVETIADAGTTNRFHNYAFPGVRDRIEKRATEHPGIDDGYAAQLFTDAAAISAREGRWVMLKEMAQAGIK